MSFPVNHRQKCGYPLAILLGISLLGTISPHASTTTIRTDGTVLKNGRAHFPFGMYSVHWTESTTDRINCLKELSKGGFTITHIENAGEFRALIDTADKLGIDLIVGTPYNPNVVGSVDAWKNRPSLFGWGLADDGDDGAAGRENIDVLKARNDAIKAKDPDHITYLPFTGWNKTRRSQSVANTSYPDVSALEIYPIGAPSGYDVTTSNALMQTYWRTRLYVEGAEAAHHSGWMLPQTFSWGSQAPAPRYPTDIEERNMVYSGLASGAKGMLSYDFSFDLMNQTPLWQEFKLLAGDVRRLAGPLLDGKLTRMATGDSFLVASSWEYADTAFVVVINTSYSATKTVNLTIPATHAGPAQSLFARLPVGLTFANNKLAGQIKPQEVHVYRLNVQGSTGIGASDGIKRGAIGRRGGSVRLFDVAGRQIGQGHVRDHRIHSQRVAVSD